MLKRKTLVAQGFSIAAVVFGALYHYPAAAQYKCNINGGTVYSDTPCAANAKNVRAPHDSVTQEQYLRKQIQNLQDQRRKAQIEQREAIEDEISAIEDAQRKQAKLQAARDKKRECDELKRQMASNKRDLARYEDFGMASSHRQRQYELRDNEERYRRECR